MHLYFFRHAIADDYDGTTPDHLRKLTGDGILRTRRAARVLKTLSLTPDRLYSSPLIRARQTADILGETLGVAVQVRQELSPGFNINAVERLTNDLGEGAQVMFVGHEPDFSVTVNTLTGGRVDMKKGCLVGIQVNFYQPLQGTITFMLSPKVFNKLG